jgi:hypothetical protein
MSGCRATRFDPPPFQRPVKTDDRGVFEFEELPPGTYVFGVNLTKRPGAGQTGKPVFQGYLQLWWVAT